jgi:hypothetical protein
MKKAAFFGGLLMDYRYFTYDHITGEAHYYFDFDDLKNYLDL